MNQQSFNEYLLSHLEINPEESARLLAEVQQTKLSLPKILQKEGIIEERQLSRLVADYFSLPFLERKDYPQKPLILERISIGFLKRHCVLPLEQSKDEVIIVISDPFDLSLMNTIKQYFNSVKVKFCIGLPSEIKDAIDRLYGDQTEEIQNAMGEAEAEVFELEEENLRDMALEAPIVRLVNMIINRAVEMRSSDVHFEPFEKEFKVRYRIDGILHEMETPPKRLQPAIISRVKLMAGMNIAERRLPQDGRIKLRLRGREVDIRVSTLPTIFGESVVLRLLYQETEELELESLGLTERDMALLQEKIYYPNGIILVTGPTGSGKTTTLYGVLKKIRSPEKKIITVEDPVEYQIEGINQIQVRTDLDLTFAKALRSIVRQDPDVILIGEIRDLETAEIAIQSALTGHLVFSTLHTNDAPTAVTRLIDLQVEPYLISASLLLVVAQRLVRVLCPHCKAPFKPDKAIIKRIRTCFPPEAAEVVELDRKDITFYKSVGCPECGHTGYLGRVGLFEIMEVTDSIRSLIIEGADTSHIRKEAIKEGMTTMRLDGLKKVIKGITTIEEVLRVTKL